MEVGAVLHSEQRLFITKRVDCDSHAARLYAILPHCNVWLPTNFNHPNLEVILGALPFFGADRGMRPRFLGQSSSYRDAEASLSRIARTEARIYLGLTSRAYESEDIQDLRRKVSRAWNDLCKLARQTYAYCQTLKPRQERKAQGRRLFKEHSNPKILLRRIERSLENERIAKYTDRNLAETIQLSNGLFPTIAPVLLSKYFALLREDYETAALMRDRSSRAMAEQEMEDDLKRRVLQRV
ncbi:hypothetical protein HY493_04280 [Candidatus Woesearchaeota archaeon]|nr:hypothetical protein [Candidatus Woesearchaeota archaeon]